MHTTLLATGYRFYTHGLIGWIVLGLICTLIGYLFGSYLWKRWRAEAERFDALTAQIERESKTARKEISDLEAKVAELEADVA